MNVVIRVLMAIVFAFTCLVAMYEITQTHYNQSVNEACGKAGPSCRHCYPGVYTAQCPK